MMLRKAIFPVAMASACAIGIWAVTSGAQEAGINAGSSLFDDAGGGAPADTGESSGFGSRGNYAGAGTAATDDGGESRFSSPLDDNTAQGDPLGLSLNVETRPSTTSPQKKLQQQDHQLSQKTQQLVQKLRTTDSSADRQAALTELQKTVGEHFDLREQMRELELKQLEARVQKLRQIHDRRQAAKAEIVRRRIEQLAQDADGLGWSSAAPGGVGNANRNYYYYAPRNTAVEKPYWSY